MKVRSFAEIFNDLKDIDFEAIEENVVTGEEYECWVKSRFIENVDEIDTVEVSSNVVCTVTYKISASDNSKLNSKNNLISHGQSTLLCDGVEKADLNMKFSINSYAKEINKCDQDFSTAA